MLKANQMPNVKIRMYNVGFGDCFLVTITEKNGKRWRALIDCGSIKMPESHSLERVVAHLIDEITEDGRARLDLVIGTHRHKDHVSGFANERWSEVSVGEVWLPWTEDPLDPSARCIREAQSRLAMAVSESRKASPGIDQAEDCDLRLAINALSNERAMATLHHGFTGVVRRRFLSREKSPTISLSDFPRLRVFVLGPSVREQAIRDMDPPVGQSYLRLLQGCADGEGDSPRPFPVAWEVEAEMGHLGLTESEIQEIRQSVEAADNAAATALDKAVNGTSIFLAFAIGGQTLLFPGDAQWGTWNLALTDPENRRLLERATFLKLSHHGSHNGTPVEFVQMDRSASVPVMISTCAVEQWADIPRAPLLAELQAGKFHYFRSDMMKAEAGASWTFNSNLYAELELPLS